MLSVIDVISSLSNLIEAKFPDYPVNDRDTEESYPRPSYYIDIDEVRGENVTNQYVKEESDLILYFFAEDRYTGFLSLLDMKNELLALLNEPLPLMDGSNKVVAHVTFDNVNATVFKADKALKCTVTSILVQDAEHIEPTDSYLIEHIDLDVGVN